jgi:hypothetical protein
MEYGSFNADQFRHQLMNYTEGELMKLGKSVFAAASRWLDPMPQQLNASKHELCRREWREGILALHLEVLSFRVVVSPLEDGMVIGDQLKALREQKPTPVRLTTRPRYPEAGGFTHS